MSTPLPTNAGNLINRAYNATGFPAIGPLASRSAGAGAGAGAGARAANHVRRIAPPRKKKAIGFTRRAKVKFIPTKNENTNNTNANNTGITYSFHSRNMPTRKYHASKTRHAISNIGEYFSTGRQLTRKYTNTKLQENADTLLPSRISGISRMYAQVHKLGTTYPHIPLFKENLELARIYYEESLAIATEMGALNRKLHNAVKKGELSDHTQDVERYSKGLKAITEFLILITGLAIENKTLFDTLVKNGQI